MIVELIELATEMNGLYKASEDSGMIKEEVAFTVH